MSLFDPVEATLQEVHSILARRTGQPAMGVSGSLDAGDNVDGSAFWFYDARDGFLQATPPFCVWVPQRVTINHVSDYKQGAVGGTTTTDDWIRPSWYHELSLVVVGRNKADAYNIMKHINECIHELSGTLPDGWQRCPRYDISADVTELDAAQEADWSNSSVSIEERVTFEFPVYLQPIPQARSSG